MDREWDIFPELSSAYYPLKRLILDLHAMAETEELTSLHLGTLGVLSRRGSLPVSELARTLQVPKPQMTVILDRLTEQGMVERRGSSEDRRVVEVSATPAGRTTLESSVNRIEASFSERMASRLSREDVAELHRCLRSLAGILGKL